LRALLKKQANAEVLLGEVTDIDVANRKVRLREGEVTYDTLVVATGVRHQYFGRDDWEPFAPGLKTVEDATAIRARILTAFEQAERVADPEANPNPNPDDVRPWLRFIVVGGGPTGVEMAGTLCELARDTLRGNFRHIDPAQAEVIVVEATDRVLPTFKPVLSAKALKSLEKLGATVRLNTRVTDIKSHRVTVQAGDRTEIIPTHTILWAAGVQASPLGSILAKATNTQLDRAGRVMVQPDCSVPGHPEIFVIGDLAHLIGPDGQPLPGVAQPAIQEGRYVGKLIAARMRGESMSPFRYRDLGNLATIGRHAAVADLGWCRFSGWLAWWVWLFVHLMHIVQFHNRVLVLMQWAWNYFTRNRAARLITESQVNPGTD
jgi:NADH dehydrogenase